MEIWFGEVKMRWKVEYFMWRTLVISGKIKNGSINSSGDYVPFKQ